MSKEVSLTGIQMTASTPEDIQISLGLGTNEGLGSFPLKSAGETGAIWDATNKKSNVGDPSTEAGTTDWTNTINVGEYYHFDYLTPATSINGLNIYYTSDATGSGKTIREDASGVSTFAAAAASGIADPTSAGTYVANASATTGSYYVDIPVWFRTSVKGNSGNVDLAVIATFSDPDATAEDPNIHKAARVALLSTENTPTSAGVICDAGTSYYHTYASNQLTDGDTAVCASGTWATTIGTANAATSEGENTWGNVDFVKQATTLTDGLAAATDDTVVSVPKAGTDARYGTAVKYTLRIWLEGEDVNCWNETSAQNFQIDLRFVRKAAAQASGG